MTKRSLSEQFDAAVEAMMADRTAPPTAANPQLAGVLRVASDLLDLPREAFKVRLKANLAAMARGLGADAAAIYGKPLVSLEDISARLRELAEGPRFVPYDTGVALRDLPELNMRFLAALNQSTLIVSRASTTTHWERHPDGDELLHILEGEADIITLTDAGPVQSTVHAGSLYVCPQGLWHQLRPRSPLALLSATPALGTEASDAADPRRTVRGTIHQESTTARRPGTLVTYDLAAALDGLPELVITPNTTGEEADAAVRMITAVGPCSVGVMRYSGLTPWERHPDGDELLHVLEGAVDVTVLTDDEPLQVTVCAGSIFVCPRGLWHRQLPRPAVTMLFGTPTQGSQASFADDPRRAD